MIMETRDRSFYPASPHPGHGHLTDWIANPYSIVFTGVVLFILIFGIAIFQGYRQFETTRNNALSTDKTTASLLSDLISENNKATTGILQSYAHRPLFIDAVKNKNLAGANRHLSDLKKNAEIDLTFVTDKRGILWANFPLFPEAMGKDLSSSDWYKGISSHRKPYISPVFKRIVGNKPLAVKEKKQQIEMIDPQKDQEKSYLTIVPVGDIGWTVILERSLRDIFRSDLRRFIEIGAVSFLLFLLIIFFWFI